MKKDEKKKTNAVGDNGGIYPVFCLLRLFVRSLSLNAIEFNAMRVVWEEGVMSVINTITARCCGLQPCKQANKD